MSAEHYVATLEERILDLMFDGEQWTVMRLAQALGVRPLRVRIRLGLLAVDGEVHRVRTEGKGDAVVFKCGPAPFDAGLTRRREKRSKRTRMRRRWPELDPLVAAAFLAMARHP